jgi:putative membrane protein insertion efficiency factor
MRGNREAVRSRLERVLVEVAAGVIAVYRAVLSPVLPRACRFRPTCSEYAIEALRKHGAVKGAALAARRILRCHPLGGSGLDPVP